MMKKRQQACGNRPQECSLTFPVGDSVVFHALWNLLFAHQQQGAEQIWLFAGLDGDHSRDDFINIWTDPTVAFLHAELELKHDGEIYLKDNDFQSGTVWNGTVLSPGCAKKTYHWRHIFSRPNIILCAFNKLHTFCK